MIQAKLRKLENRAEIHRAENVLYIINKGNILINPIKDISKIQK